MVAVELKKQLEIENHNKKIEGARKGAKIVNAMLSGERLPKLIREGELEPSSNKHDNESARQAARILGTNETYVRDAEKILKASPKLADLVRDDKLNILQANSALKQRETHEEAFAALEQGQIDFHQFRNWCCLKGEFADLWQAFHENRMTPARLRLKPTGACFRFAGLNERLRSFQ